MYKTNLRGKIIEGSYYSLVLIMRDSGLLGSRIYKTGGEYDN